MAYDPNLPIRGRYASMRLVVQAPGMKTDELIRGRKQNLVVGVSAVERARLEVREGQLFAVPDESGSVYYNQLRQEGTPDSFSINEPVAFFIPDTAQDPTRRKPSEELWAEVNVPRRGPPRPIRLAVKSGGQMRPLDLE